MHATHMWVDHMADAQLVYGKQPTLSGSHYAAMVYAATIEHMCTGGYIYLHGRT